jgi:hypothetical protein
MKWKDREAQLSDEGFMRRYKVSKAAFRELALKIRPLVGRKASNRWVVSSSGSGVPTELCLSMTLRYLAGGHVYDIIDLHGVGRSTFYKVLWSTMSAISQVLRLQGIPHQDMSALRFALATHSHTRTCKRTDRHA